MNHYYNYIIIYHYVILIMRTCHNLQLQFSEAWSQKRCHTVVVFLVFFCFRSCVLHMSRVLYLLASIFQGISSNRNPKIAAQAWDTWKYEVNIIDFSQPGFSCFGISFGVAVYCKHWVVNYKWTYIYSIIHDISYYYKLPKRNRGSHSTNLYSENIRAQYNIWILIITYFNR